MLEASVTNEKKAALANAPTQEDGPRCPTCAAFPKLATKFLDPQTGKIIRLYRCTCGERIWDD